MSESFEVENIQPQQQSTSCLDSLDEYRWQTGFYDGCQPPEDNQNRQKTEKVEKAEKTIEYLDFSPPITKQEQIKTASQTTERERPSVEIYLHKNVRSGQPPTPEEIGNKIADALGFSQSEREMYASLKKCKTTGAAFFQANEASTEGINWLQLAKTDPMGRVRVSELHPGAIAETRQWLLDFRARQGAPDTISQYNYEQQRTALEAVVANVYNPIAGGVGAAMGSIGDVVQGIGLPLHAIYNRTFMDQLADTLRKEGRGLPMYSLYTQAEMNDAIVGLANMYCLAGGSALPYMGPGLLARGAALTPRAVGLVGQLTGLSGTTGQVYDTAVEIQAAEIAKKEGVTNEGALLKRIEEIKKGESINATTRQEIETRSLIAAAFAAPAGIVQGTYLKSLSGYIAKGTPAQEIPRTLIKEVSTSLVKGGAISTAQFAYTQGVLFGSGVVDGEKALRNTIGGAPETFVKGAMIAGGAEALRLSKQRVQGEALPKGNVLQQQSEAQPKMQPQLQQQQQSRAYGNPYEQQQMRARQEQQMRARMEGTPHQYQQQEQYFDRNGRLQFEAHVQRQGFQRGVNEGSVGVYTAQPQIEGRPEARDVWYVNGESKQYLSYRSGWYYGKSSNTTENLAPVKVHVLTESAADLKQLQKVLIPALQNDPELQKVACWKTMDPMDGFERGYSPVTGIGQNGKAFTIYANSTKEAAEIHGRIDQILTQHNLRAPGQIAHQTTDIPHGNSNRVALSADFFDRTVANNRNAAIVDQNVEYALKYVNGLPPNMPFTEHQLRKIEADSGLQPRILAYDVYGRLALTTEGSPTIRKDRIYLSEGGEQHQWGAMTGRFALYSLYRRVNIEPARAELLK